MQCITLHLLKYDAFRSQKFYFTRQEFLPRGSVKVQQQGSVPVIGVLCRVRTIREKWICPIQYWSVYAVLWFSTDAVSNYNNIPIGHYKYLFCLIDYARHGNVMFGAWQLWRHNSVVSVWPTAVVWTTQGACIVTREVLIPKYFVHVSPFILTRSASASESTDRCCIGSACAMICIPSLNPYNLSITGSQ